MKHLKYFFLAFTVSGLLFLGACDNGSDPEPQTVAEKISKSWKVQSATQDVGSGSESVTFDFSSFRLTLASTDGEPTTYSITPGGLTDGKTPNYNGSTNSGTWTISGNTTSGTIVFEDAAASDSSVTYSFDESAGTLTLTWTVSIDIDKTEPSYTFVLESAS